MDTNTSSNENDLSDVERRLAGWIPAAENLDGAAMLFAAGLAAGRRQRDRFLWPVFLVLLTAQAIGLGTWGLTERAGRQALVSRLGAPSPASGETTVIVLAEDTSTWQPDGYLNLRRQIVQDPGVWLASREPAGPQSAEPPSPEAAMLRAGQYESLLTQ
jgi:hypothetical protein